MSGNLTIDNVNIENNPIPVMTNIQYDSELDMGLYDTVTSGNEWSIDFIVTDNIVMSNFRFYNVSAGLYSELFDINAKNVTILNITMIDSPLCCAEDGEMSINAEDNLIIDNFQANNISLAPGNNHTYYNPEVGKYVWIIKWIVKEEDSIFMLLH